MLNKAVLHGRLTADPELRQTQSGVANVFFTVAWSEKYKEVEKKCFLPCKAWRSTAEFLCKYFKKGQELIVSGKLVTEEWTAQDGSKRSSLVLDVDVDGIHFCGAKREADGNSTSAVPSNTPASAPATAPRWETVSGDEGLPF